MTVDQLTSSSPIEPIESDLVQTKDAHSTDENDDSGVDEQDPITSSDENESNEKNEENIVTIEKIADASIECDTIVPTVDAVPDVLAKSIEVDTSEIDDAIRYKNLKIMYGGRDILDFCGNIANKSWHIQYTFLPEKNISMCLANRSQYHRLSANWDAKLETKMDTCRKCSFQYPVKTPDYQCISANKTTILDSINSMVPNDNIKNNSNIKNFHGMMYIGNQQKSFNSFKSAPNNAGMNNSSMSFNSNGYQSMYPNQYNNTSAMNTSAISTSKQANYGHQHQYGAYRQTYPNNTSNNANNYGKMPYKMYSHFY